MNVQELINRLAKFDPDMEIKIAPKGIMTPTEDIITVEPARYPCPRHCILISGD